MCHPLFYCYCESTYLKLKLETLLLTKFFRPNIFSLLILTAYYPHFRMDFLDYQNEVEIVGAASAPPAAAPVSLFTTATPAPRKRPCCRRQSHKIRILLPLCGQIQHLRRPCSTAWRRRNRKVLFPVTLTQFAASNPFASSMDTSSRIFRRWQ